MNRLLISISIIFALSSCYQAPELSQFNTEKWTKSIEDCDAYRIEAARQLLSDSTDVSKVLGSNQNEIKELFGNPDRHRLFNRNQKFFYYNLDCENKQELSVRFDALGRVKELQVISTQYETRE